MRTFELDTLDEIIQTITRNKMRSLMTAFGVFWGIFMLIIMVGAGNGLSEGVSSGVKEFASNSVFIFPGRTSMPYKGFQTGRYWEMKTNDMTAITNQYDGIKYISGMIFGNSSTVVHEDKYGSFSVRGVSPDYTKIDAQRLLYGRYLNQIDISESRKVCLIGEKVYTELFTNGTNPTGELIRVGGIYYSVAGVITPATENININGDMKEGILIPISTAQKSMNMADNIHAMAITMDDNLDVSEYEESLKNLIKSRHNVALEDEKGIMSFNVAEIFKSFNGLFNGINLLIWIVGLGTLIAGVIGVSNIMLVTVKERTQEIGIRRALGARPVQIMTQIMSESLMLTTLAGVVGMIISVGILIAISTVIEANPDPESFFGSPIVPFNLALIATMVLMICGLLSGLLPSYRALQIKAIDALRDE